MKPRRSMPPGSGTWIGVLGGGQLGRMFALEARRMGYHVLKWTGGDRSGAAFTADRVLDDPFDSPSALETFVDQVDVATVEFENIPRSLLQAVEQRVPLMPGSAAVATCQHREREKTFLEKHGLPCAKFAVVTDADELAKIMAELDDNAILKTAAFGYDGKGQMALARNTPPDELAKLWSRFGAERAVLEEKVELALELSVLVARNRKGEIVTYDPAENRHRHHILDLSILPARLSRSTNDEARDIALAVAEALDYNGLLAVEFFLSADGRLLVNELAPRPHNSGHHTLDACATSQFEQQLRVLCDLPLGSPRLLQPAVMWNLIGDLWLDETTPPDWTPVLATPGAKLHLYGKWKARPGRKMGHVTFLAETPEKALIRASECRQAYGLEAVE